VMAAEGTDGEEPARRAAADTLRGHADALEAADGADPAALAAALGRVVGATLPAMPVVELADGSLAEVAREGRRRLGDSARVRTWMLANGRVHDGMGALHQAVMLTEMISDRPVMEPGLMQFPALPEIDDGWAGLDLPDFSAARSRVGVVTVNDPIPALKSQRVCGLLFDGWSETIPGTDAVTGVAVHFDAPSSQAPQAVLLAVAPDGRNWSVDLMVETVRQTAQAARNRAVGPETMAFYGQILPAVYIDDKATVMTQDEQRSKSRGEDGEQR